MTPLQKGANELGVSLDTLQRGEQVGEITREQIAKEYHRYNLMQMRQAEKE